MHFGNFSHYFRTIQKETFLSKQNLHTCRRYLLSFVFLHCKKPHQIQCGRRWREPPEHTNTSFVSAPSSHRNLTDLKWFLQYAHVRNMYGRSVARQSTPPPPNPLLPLPSAPPPCPTPSGKTLLHPRG